MDQIIRILQLEDNPVDSEHVRSRLEAAGLVCRINRVWTHTQFETALRQDKADIILSDFQLLRYDGISALKLAREIRPDVPFVFVSGMPGEEAAISGLTQGAADYVLKHNLERLESAIKQAVTKGRKCLEQKRLEQDEAKPYPIKQLGTFFDNVAIPLCFINKKTSMLHFNARFEETFGYSREDIPTLKEWWQLAYPDPDYREWVLSKCFEEIERATRTGTDIEPIEYNVTCKNGDVRAMVVLGSFIDQNLLLTFFDITKRKQAEDALRESEELFSAAFHASPSLIAITSLDGTLLEVNEGYSRMLGYSKAESIGKTTAELSIWGNPEDRAVFISHLKADGQITDFETTLRHKDGSILTVIDSARIITLKDETCVLSIVHDISERKHAEEILINSEKRYHMVFENSPIALWEEDFSKVKHFFDDLKQKGITDLNKYFTQHPEALMQCVGWVEIVDVNNAALMLHGAANKEELLKSLNNVFTPESLETFQHGLVCLWNKEIKMSRDAVVMTLSGEQRYVTVSFAVCPGYEETLSKILVSTADITERKRAEEKELHSDQRLRLHKEMSPLGFLEWDENFRAIEWNAACERIFGYTREEAVGRHARELILPKEVHGLVDGIFKRMMNLTGGQHSVNKNITKDGRIIICEWFNTTLVNKDGKAIGVASVCNDITEQKRVEESIRKLSQAVEQSPVSILITDTDGKIEFVNTKFTQITGYTHDEAMGVNPRMLKSGKTPHGVYKRLWETISSGEVWQGELQNRKKNKELFWEQATIAPVRNADNITTHYVAVKEDITERKKMEEQFRQTQKMEAVGQLAGGVAHDFNNMLSVIVGHAEMVMENPELPVSLQKDIKGILAASHRSTDITRQLLAFARKQTILPKVLDLNRSVEVTLKLIRRLIGEDIDLLWQPGSNLQPIKMDPSQVDQILVNLCVNAKDAINGMGKITIETKNADLDHTYCGEHEGFCPGRYVMLAISDNGAGMDEQTMEKIFEPFYTTKETGKGTGLGLATIYGIVRQNNGFVNAYSEVGYGSTFKIYLPRHAAPKEKLQTKQPALPTARPDELILVVEDEIPVLDMVHQMLERCGYSVLASSSPGEAVRIVEEHSDKISLLLTDLVMPEMTGPSLAKKLQILKPGLNCLFMSGYTDNVIAHHDIVSEDIHFIQKPFTMQEMAAKIRNVLDGL